MYSTKWSISQDLTLFADCYKNNMGIHEKSVGIFYIRMRSSDAFLNQILSSISIVKLYVSQNSPESWEVAWNGPHTGRLVVTTGGHQLLSSSNK